VEVGEQHLVGPQEGVLGRDGLLDLQQQVGVAPDVSCSANHGGAGLGEVFVGDCRAQAGSGLDQDGVAAAGQVVHTSRRDRDAILLALDLCGDADLH